MIPRSLIVTSVTRVVVKAVTAELSFVVPDET